MAMKQVYAVGDEPVPGAGYRLVAFLGRGGFGEVWKATTPGGAEAAVKIIHLGGVEGRKEFRALQLVKRIRHPNLMPLVAFWLKGADGTVLDEALAEQPELGNQETSGEAFQVTMPVATVCPPPAPAELVIVMGLGDKTLIDRLQECRDGGLSGIPVEELLGYMEDAAEAIDYLNSPVHDQGAGPMAIQHCDIKPHNLMIVGGALQVCDFGLARMMGVERVTTGAASIAYAAPELLESNRVSASTDQYSLAITYYELRCGTLPYRDETIAAALEAKQNETLDFTACWPAEQKVLQRATSRDPARRFPSAMELVRALREATSEISAGAAEEERPAWWSRMRGWQAVLAAVILLSLAGAAGYGAWRYFRPTTEAARPAGADQDAAVSAAVVAAEAALRRGTELLERRDYDGAIAEFTAAAALNPKDVRPLSRRAFAWFRKEEFQKAVDDYGAALAISPAATDYVDRGRSYFALRRFREAMADFDAALRSSPGYPAAYYFRGDCRQKLEKYSEAVADLTEAIKLAGQSPDPRFTISDAYALRGSAHYLSGEASEAVEDFTAAIRLAPDDPASVYQLRASAYDLQKRPDLAKRDNQIADLLKRIEASGKDAADWDALADAYAEAGQWNDAVRSAKRAIELAPNEEAAKRYRGKLTGYEKKASAK